jgi:hypothetical protein
MNTAFIVGYLSICIGTGFVLSLDVLFATIARLREGISFANWILPVALLHTIFPTISFSLAWGAEQLFSAAAPLVSFAGFVLVALFLYEEFCEKIGVRPVVAIVSALAKLLKLARHTTTAFLAAVAVSWDALLFGPTFVATKASEGWGVPEAFLAFIIIGLTVLCITALTPLFAHAIIERIKRHDVTLVAKIARTHLLADLAVFSVIGGFGILSLWNVFSGDANLGYSVLISTIIWSLLFYIYRRSLMQTECDEAAEVFLEEDA